MFVCIGHRKSVTNTVFLIIGGWMQITAIWSFLLQPIEFPWEILLLGFKGTLGSSMEGAKWQVCGWDQPEFCSFFFDSGSAVLMAYVPFC